MSGTIRTTAFLLASDFQDGQAPGSITPSRMRDYIATVQSLTGVVYTPEQYGAAADGATNDTTAIQNCINAVSASGNGVVLFGRGKSYAYNAVITVPAEVILLGYGATLVNIATGNAGNLLRAIHLNGIGACVLGLTLQCPIVARDNSGSPNGQGIWLDTGFTQNLVRDCWVYGGAGGGIYNQGASYGWILDNRVEQTAADGISSLNGTNNMQIQGNICYHTGDDGISAFTVSGDASVIQHNSIVGNKIFQAQARGISIIGCTDMLVADNLIVDSQDPSIYVASETSPGANMARVKLTGNYCQHGNIAGAYLGDIAVIPNAVVSTTTVNDVSITSNFVTASNGPGISVYGNGTTVGGFKIDICANHITGTTGNGIDIEPNAVTGCLISSNYVANTGDVGIFVDVGNAGLNINTNTIDTATTYAVQVNSTASAVTGNTARGSYTFGLFLGSGAGGATTVVTGNNWGGSGQSGTTGVVTNR